MELEIDEDLTAVAESIETHMVASKRVPVAEAMAALAPILWGRHQKEEVFPSFCVLRLRFLRQMMGVSDEPPRGG